MKLLEIQRELKKRRRFRQGPYAISVKLEHPGDPYQEFLNVQVNEGDDVVAKAGFKQWETTSKWEPLSVQINQHEKRNKLREMIHRAAITAGFFVKD